MSTGHNYQIILSYDGTDFLGWQSQPGGGTVQDCLNQALATALRTEVSTLAAGRTDRGVHAEGQVVGFQTEELIDPNRLRHSLNALLPPTIGVLSIRKRERDFHPIRSTTGKAYRYLIRQGPGRDPFQGRFMWAVPQVLDLEALSQALPQLLGKHDFSSFCAADGGAVTKVRSMSAAELEYRDGVLALWFVGDGFLKQMVRTLVGTLVDIGHGKRTTSEISRLLEVRDRREASATAPPQGLSLVHVFEDPIPDGRQLRQWDRFRYFCPRVPGNLN